MSRRLFLVLLPHHTHTEEVIAMTTERDSAVPLASAVVDLGSSSFGLVTKSHFVSVTCYFASMEKGQPCSTISEHRHQCGRAENTSTIYSCF